MEGGVMIYAEEAAARKRAAEEAIQNSQSAKRAAISDQGGDDSQKEKSILRCSLVKRGNCPGLIYGGYQVCSQTGMESAFHNVET
eukprot:528650-Pyramimonas_sp.AAC.1